MTKRPDPSTGAQLPVGPCRGKSERSRFRHQRPKAYDVITEAGTEPADARAFLVVSAMSECSSAG